MNQPKINRFDVWCDCHWFTIEDREPEGALIRVSDLKQWLNVHMKEGKISEVYTDLLKALGE